MTFRWDDPDELVEPLETDPVASLLNDVVVGSGSFR